MWEDYHPLFIIVSNYLYMVKVFFHVLFSHDYLLYYYLIRGHPVLFNYNIKVK